MPADTVEIRRGRRGRHRAPERLGPGRDRARRRRRGHGRHVPALPARLRREPPLLARLRRRRCGRPSPATRVLLSVGQAPNLAFLADGGTDVEEMRPGWPKVDPATLATTAPGRLRRRRPRARHAAAHRRGRLGQGGGALGLPHAHRPRARRPTRSTAHPDARPATAASAATSRSAASPCPVAEPEERLQAPRGARSRPGTRASRRMREASRCLDCGVTPVFDGTRCVLCGGCVDVCPTLCLKLVPLADLAPSPDARGRHRPRPRRGADLGDATPPSSRTRTAASAARSAPCAARRTRSRWNACTFATTWRTA